MFAVTLIKMCSFFPSEERLNHFFLMQVGLSKLELATQCRALKLLQMFFSNISNKFVLEIFFFSVCRLIRLNALQFYFEPEPDNCNKMFNRSLGWVFLIAFGSGTLNFVFFPYKKSKFVLKTLMIILFIIIILKNIYLKKYFL